MIKLRNRIYEIIFEAVTRAGKIFDEALLGIILLSILLVMLESVAGIRLKYYTLLRALEWTITIIFTTEYLLRVWVTPKPFRYIFSFYGLIDLLAIIPSYLGLVFTGTHSLIVIRALRFLRIFRVLKLGRYTRAGRPIGTALWRSREKIIVFVLFVLMLAVIIGTLMYLIEGEENGFTDIPTSIYWAIVTLTTVGYGDLSPVSGMGKFLASLVMILGYAIIAVPTGIVTASLLDQPGHTNTTVCPSCMCERHDDDAQYCRKCGTYLDRQPHEDKNKERKLNE